MTILTHATESVRPAASGSWLVGARFDLLFLFGGALLSLIALGLTLGLGVSVVAVYWIWLVGFDGPHMAAAYTRTYLDRTERRERARLLWGSLGFFLLGPAALVLGRLLDTQAPFEAFLALGTAYSYYHVVRQHYGFVALYKTKGEARSRRDFYIDKWSLYVGAWAPYVLFLITHARARVQLGMAPAEAPPPLLSWLLLGAWALSLLLFVANAYLARARPASPQKVAYGVTVLVLYAFINLLISRFEPVYGASTGPDTDFLLLTVMLSIFHSLQYVALVFSYNRRRYRGEDAAARYGLAGRASGRFQFFALGLAAYAALYFVLAAATGVMPEVRWFAGLTVWGFSVNQLMLGVWWGIALHHYVLDQYIWRLRRDTKLRDDLGVAHA